MGWIKGLKSPFIEKSISKGLKGPKRTLGTLQQTPFPEREKQRQGETHKIIIEITAMSSLKPLSPPTFVSPQGSVWSVAVVKNSKTNFKTATCPVSSALKTAKQILRLPHFQSPQHWKRDTNVWTQNNVHVLFYQARKENRQADTESSKNTIGLSQLSRDSSKNTQKVVA